MTLAIPRAGVGGYWGVNRERCRDGKLRVVDYKTGKIPNLKYSDATNQRIMDDKFYQLQVSKS